VRSHDDKWIDHFRAEGYAEAAPLSSGMEGAVYRLGGGLVAKVWGDKSATSLGGLEQFYADLARASLPFATPEIVAVNKVGSTAITIERELPGRPLREFLSPSDSSAPTAAQACVMTLLEGLASVGEFRSALDLPVLSETGPFRGEAGWAESLVRLMSRRVAVFGGQLRAAVPNFDAVYARLTASISALPPVDDRVIHGDICPENILVDDDMIPLALLDWGFLSMAGDPAFEASVAAGIFNMYGPHALEIDMSLTGRFASALGHPIDRLLIYRAAYAVATSNAYDVNGQDGGFAWCAAALNRSDVRAALAT
jgi:aminoglycoside phosphotransferase (APT) family kinase protein